MMLDLTDEERRDLKRISDEPWLWLRKYLPEAKKREDELFDLLDVLKAVWVECQQYRINLCFAVEFEVVDTPKTMYTLRHYRELQKLQNSSNSALVFVIDLKGSVIDHIDIGQEVLPTSIMYLSQMREKLMLWLGPCFEIYCKGYRWDPRQRQAVLKDIKSKRRDRLLSMDKYRSVLDAHYERCIRGEATVDYWFSGCKNRILRDAPERIFQKSLVDFLNREVDCISADPEPMFRDRSRCDVRIFVENLDLYFIEIKWIGYAARRLEGSPTISAEKPLSR